MKLFAVNNYLLSIEGNQFKGWSFSDSGNSREVLFNFEIECLDKEAGYLLLCYSDNEEVYADTWHETIEEGIEFANKRYGISKDLWKEIN